MLPIKPTTPHLLNKYHCVVIACMYRGPPNGHTQCGVLPSPSTAPCSPVCASWLKNPGYPACTTRPRSHKEKTKICVSPDQQELGFDALLFESRSCTCYTSLLIITITGTGFTMNPKGLPRQKGLIIRLREAGCVSLTSALMPGLHCLASTQRPTCWGF